MIVKEFFETRFDGVNLYRTYSDEIFYLRQIEIGNIYAEAVDIENAPYTYEETEDVIEDDLKELISIDGSNMDKMVEE